MSYPVKVICCCLPLFLIIGKGFGQKQDKDSLPDYFREFRYYRLPGMPNSATFYRQIYSFYKRQQRIDSLHKRRDSLLQEQKKNIPAKTILAYRPY
jgi:hypothetical protein